jgi:hypothetical protein
MKILVTYLLIQLLFTESIFRGIYIIKNKCSNVYFYEINNDFIIVNNDNNSITYDFQNNNIIDDIKKRFIFAQNINPLDIIYLFL